MGLRYPIRMERHKLSRLKNLQIIKDRGLEVLSDWTGQRVADKHNTHINVTVRNTTCGHIFTSSAVNLLTRGITCKICGIEQRTKNINEWSKANSAEWQKTADIWKKYRANVTRMTRATYKKHKNQINPMGLPFGRCGDDGKYQLDHIVPVRWCFEHYVPVEMVAALDNLQILDWRTNVSSRDHLKGELPVKFRMYADK